MAARRLGLVEVAGKISGLTYTDYRLLWAPGGSSLAPFDQPPKRVESPSGQTRLFAITAGVEPAGTAADYIGYRRSKQRSGCHCGSQ